jgi:hypothetical protein
LKVYYIQHSKARNELTFKIANMASTTPTIQINAPTTVTVPKPDNTTTTSPPTATTVTSPASASKPSPPKLIQSCYLCDEQNPGDFTPTTKFLATCLLCSRFFCPIHKSEQWETVCNINHSSYYQQCLAKARTEMAAQGKDVDGVGQRSIAEFLFNEGIYPSLGEREKAIFTTSPVSDCEC